VESCYAWQERAGSVSRLRSNCSSSFPRGTILERALFPGGSLHRLLMHLWPLALFVFFLRMATPEEALGRSRRGPSVGSPVAPVPELATMECNA
jgi:hypothetical protein